HIIRNVNQSSTSVSEKSTTLMDASRNVKTGTEQMVITMEELAKGSESQANHASNLAEKMQEFVESVGQSEQKGQSITEDAKAVLSVTSDGRTLMQQSVQQMNKIDHIVSQSV